MFLRQQKERRTGKKQPKTIACSVCNAQGFVKMSPGEASSWEHRQPGEQPGQVVQRCWACDGKGRIPIERRQLNIERFDRS